MPRHAIELDGDDWAAPENQVVSGPFRIERLDEGQLVLVRRDDYAGRRSGNANTVTMTRLEVGEDLRRTSAASSMRSSTAMPCGRTGRRCGGRDALGPVAATVYLASTTPASETRTPACARACDRPRRRSRSTLPANYVAATGGRRSSGPSGPHARDRAPLRPGARPFAPRALGRNQAGGWHPAGTTVSVNPR